METSIGNVRAGMAREQGSAIEGSVEHPRPELMTVADIHGDYGLGRTKTYQRIRSGEIPSYTIDGRLYIRRSEFEVWLEERRTVAPTNR